MSEDHQHEHGDADENADEKADAQQAEETPGDDAHSKVKGNVAKAVGEADAYGEG